MPPPEEKPNEFIEAYNAWRKDNEAEIATIVDRMLNIAWTAGARFGMDTAEDIYTGDRHD